MHRYLLILLSCLPWATAAYSADLRWQRDEQVAFERARSEQRFVLLYLEAVWCHWCHVMDHETYADGAVQAALAAHFVPLRIDQDSRPDLANRYRDYGWPATIVFAPDGSEIVKRQGYIAPAAMRRLLAAIVADPSPEADGVIADETTSTASALSPSLVKELAARHRRSFDAERGGMTIAQKYLDRDSVEYSLWLAARGDAIERRQAITTLDAALALIDPVWGGVYQYSTQGDWQHPHYEKLAARQGDYLRIYAPAYALTGEPRYRAAVQSIAAYLRGFLRSPDGGYHTSQDADLRPGEHSAAYFALDDSARRALGMPRIDPQRYASETGVVAEALAYWYEVSGDQLALADAVAAVRWAQTERAAAGGGFRHEQSVQGLYLSDNLAMGRALLQLYRSTGERSWLVGAMRTADVIDTRFRAASGYVSAPAGASPIAAVAQLDENISLARFANRLEHYSGVPSHRDIALHALRHLGRPEIALSRLSDVGILLADLELASDPLHLTIVGGKSEVESLALFQAGLRVPASYKRIDWWDRDEGALVNADINYPKSSRPAAFVCTERRCSTPIVRPADIAAFLAETTPTR